MKNFSKLILTMIMASLFYSVQAVNDTAVIDTCDQLGTVFFVDNIGSWWIISLDNGDILEPIDSLPPNVRQDSLRVRLSYTVDVTDSIGQWGKRVFIDCIDPVNVTPPPDCIVDFHYTPIKCEPWMSSIKCGKYTYQFEMEATDSVVYWKWIKDDFDTSYQYSPVFAFEDSGVYEICLIVVYIDGCSASHCEKIIIPSDIKCKADFDYFPIYPIYTTTDAKPDSILNNDTLSPWPVPQNTYQFIDKSYGDVVSWEWQFEDTVLYEQNVEYTFKWSGSHTVCLTIFTSDSCTSTKCVEIYIDTIPECKAYFWYYISNYIYRWEDSIEQEFMPPIDTIIDDTIPWDKTVYFYDLSYGNIISWFWDFGDSTYSKEPNPVHEYKNFGKYDVCLTIKSATGCEDTYCTIVDISKPEECQAMFEYCQYQYPSDSLFSTPEKGYIVGFKDRSTGNIYSWHWDFGDGYYSNEQNPAHKYKFPGIYKVCLEVFGNFGCYSRYCANIKVGPGCNIDFKWDVAYADCDGYMPAYDFYIINADSLSYVYWDFGDGHYSYEFNPVHIFEDLGSYNVCLTAQKLDGCVTTLCKQIIIDFEFIDSLHLKNCGTNFIKEIKNENSIFIEKVFPNPISDMVTFIIESPNNTNITLSVNNLLGAELFMKKFQLTTGNNELEVNLESIPIGNYIYRINTNDKVIHGMMMKR